MSEGAEARFDLEALWEHVRVLAPRAERVGLAVDAYVATLRTLPEAPGDLEVVRCDVPRGELAKTRAVVAELQDAWIDLRRTDVVVAVGGGATSDAVGFAAATVRRGVPWIVIPTTVLAMADAAHGGKTGINHATGKNLLGAFHAPAGVRMDPVWLDTLPVRERVAGLAEVYKSARIGDPTLHAQLREGPPATKDAWFVATTRAAAVKHALVAQDPRDRGVRRHLNFGHTLGHALERVLGNEALRHGEAVATGMVAATRLAEHRGLVGGGETARTARDLEALELPTALPPEASPESLLAALGRDKKRGAGATHTWILPTGTHGVCVVDDVTDTEILRAMAALR